MVLVEVFCFWFSVRLGSIIIGITTSLQCCALLVICGLCINNPKEYTARLHLFIDDFLAKDGNKIIPDLQIYLTPLAAFTSFLLLSSLLLIIGSFKIKCALVYPFLVTYPIYVFLLLMSHVSMMILLKNQDFGIGDLILYSNIGAFTVLFFMYTWLMVFCFVQMLRELNEQLKEKQKLNKENANIISMVPPTFPGLSSKKYVP